MGGRSTQTGIDYQNAFILWKVLDIVFDSPQNQNKVGEQDNVFNQIQSFALDRKFKEEDTQYIGDEEFDFKLEIDRIENGESEKIIFFYEVKSGQSDSLEADIRESIQTLFRVFQNKKTDTSATFKYVLIIPEEHSGIVSDYLSICKKLRKARRINQNQIEVFKTNLKIPVSIASEEIYLFCKSFELKPTPSRKMLKNLAKISIQDFLKSISTQNHFDEEYLWSHLKDLLIQLVVENHISPLEKFREEIMNWYIAHKRFLGEDKIKWDTQVLRSQFPNMGIPPDLNN